MSEKKSNIKTLILAIIAGVFAVSTVVLGIMAINLSGEMNRIKEENSKVSEDKETADNAGSLYMRLSNSYCQRYLDQDEDFCNDYNLDIIKQMMVNDAFGY